MSPELTPDQRTRKEMMARPELVEHMAYNTWHAQSGIAGTLPASEAWQELAPAERQFWINKVWERRMAR